MIIKRAKDEHGVVHEVTKLWKTLVGTRCGNMWSRERKFEGSYPPIFLLKNGNNNHINCLGCIGA